MGQRRKPRAGRRRDTDPEAVLSGREEVDAEALFRLIHRVNPTGLDLEARQERRLYDQKSRLQSLLVRRFSELVVVEATDREGVLSLRHRSGAFDACHPVVDDLEPDARSWVRHQLDLAASPEVPEAAFAVPAAAREGDAEPSDTLVARAERALADYEYDVADACLVRALEQSDGAPEAALPLLELRVELLGMDAEALALEKRLGARTRASCCSATRRVAPTSWRPRYPARAGTARRTYRGPKNFIESRSPGTPSSSRTGGGAISKRSSSAPTISTSCPWALRPPLRDPSALRWELPTRHGCRPFKAPIPAR